MAYYGINNNNNNNNNKNNNYEDYQYDDDYSYDTYRTSNGSRTYYNGSDSGNFQNKKPVPWGLIIAAFIFAWPVGIFLLISRLIYESENPNTSYKMKNQEKSRTNTSDPKSANKKSTTLMWVGIVLSFIGFMSVQDTMSYYDFWSDLSYYLEDLIIGLGFLVGGITSIAFSVKEKRLVQRFAKYVTIVGDKKCIKISEVAKKIPTSKKKAQKELQEMINRDFFKGAYLDAENDVLVFSGYEDQIEKPVTKKEEQEIKKADTAIDTYTSYINQIKDVNERIKNEQLTSQIYRIENICKNIFGYVKKHPDKEGMIRKFMQYYLPTTLKILNAYAELEKQNINGRNIASGKKDIEDTMENVVKSFENLLDKLVQSDVIDVSADLETLQNMLATDGYSDDELKLKL